ncbi:MAG: NmrA family NAD(P)-binding protein [Pseudomonadota bacterium]
MTILVFGGTGQVGSALVNTLRQSGAPVRVITRSAQKVERLPTGVEGVVADVDKPQSLIPALKGVRAVFLMAPFSQTEAHQGLTSLAMILSAGVKSLVYLSSDLSSRAPLIPHAGSKLAIEAAIRASETHHTILRPTNFAQNDLAVRDGLAAGIYPLPCGRHPIARVDTRDVADAAAKALLEGIGSRRTILLSSPDQPNGEEVAAIWSAQMGTKVTFLDETPEAWARTMRGYMPDWMVSDLELEYRYLQRFGQPITKRDLDDQALLLPDGPRRYAEFVAESCRERPGSSLPDGTNF